MPAPKGNKFWEARSRHGNKPKFESPEMMWESALDYFEWVENNPLYEARPFSYQGVTTIEKIPKMRAMTEEGFCLFADIGYSTFHDYCKKEDFSEVTTRIKATIRNQKFTGAAAEMLNPNIIARDLGLTDKQVIKQTNTNYNIPDNTDPVEAARMYQEALKGE